MACTLLNVEHAECLQLGQLGRVLTLAAFFQPLTLECRHWHIFFFWLDFPTPFCTLRALFRLFRHWPLFHHPVSWRWIFPRSSRIDDVLQIFFLQRRSQRQQFSIAGKTLCHGHVSLTQGFEMKNNLEKQLQTNQLKQELWRLQDLMVTPGKIKLYDRHRDIKDASETLHHV